MSFNEECPICLDSNPEENLFVLSCGHAVHQNCLRRSRKLECPLCREPLRNIPVDIVTDIVFNQIPLLQQDLPEDDSGDEEFDIRSLIITTLIRIIVETSTIPTTLPVSFTRFLFPTEEDMLSLHTFFNFTATPNTSS